MENQQGESKFTLPPPFPPQIKVEERGLMYMYSQIVSEGLLFILFPWNKLFCNIYFCYQSNLLHKLRQGITKNKIHILSHLGKKVPPKNNRSFVTVKVSL